MPNFEIGPDDFVDRRREREAEAELKRTMSPVAGACLTCSYDVAEEGHADWCPEKP